MTKISGNPIGKNHKESYQEILEAICLHALRQQHNWQNEAYALLLLKNVMELHSETITNAGSCYRTDY